MNNSIRPWDSEYDDFLHDESRLTGSAESISFPKTEDDAASIIREIARSKGTVTVQGARTGITAGAVPFGGHILNLSRMNSIGDIRHDNATGADYLTVEPGALLTDVWKRLEGTGLWFPPDPTEASASIGGMVSCSASGAMSYLYGSTRCWVESLRIVLADGSVLPMRRGETFAVGRRFNLTTPDGRRLSGELPDYRIPDVKSAAGYYAADDMDMLDLFIGMEGTLGAVTGIELRLMPKPACIAGLMVFLKSEECAIRFVRFLRREQIGALDALGAKPAAIEYFNHDALDLLRRMRLEYPAFSEIPLLHPHYHTTIYLELHAGSEDDIDDAMMLVMDAMTELGASDEDTWYAASQHELEKHKSFRHAVPEAVNQIIGERKNANPQLTKLGTDMSAPNGMLEDVIAMYNSGLQDARLESVIFGHIGDNHLHVNILPRNMEEHTRGKLLYMDWARQVVEAGGSISAEHGIGKLKTGFLELMYGREGIDQMIALKNVFDPDHVLNPGNLFTL